MIQTIKQDWLNDYLAENGCYVSSHPKFSTDIGLDELYDVSIRFIGNVNIGYYYFFLILTEDNSKVHIDIVKNSEKLKSFRENFKACFKKDIQFILFEQKEGEVLRVITSENYIDFINYTIETLGEFFRGMDPKFVQDIGTDKDINKSENDNFQNWTRKNLSRYITVHDFDAVYLGKEKPHILELKRIDPNTGDFKKWGPYLDDLGNYKACRAIVNSLELPPGFFITIAYSADDDSEVATHILNDPERDKITGIKALCHPKNIFRSPKYFTSKNRRVKK